MIHQRFGLFIIIWHFNFVSEEFCLAECDVTLH